MSSNQSGDRAGTTVRSTPDDPVLSLEDGGQEAAVGDTTSLLSGSDNPTHNGDPPQTSFGLASILVVLVGVAATTAFLVLGITSAKRDADLRFENTANLVVNGIQGRWAAYEGGALWIHEACRSSGGDNPPNPSLGGTQICSRRAFTQLQEYLKADGLDFPATIFAPFVNRTLRTIFEIEALSYYQEAYPNTFYFGFTGYEPSEDDDDEFEFGRRSQQEDYLPVHYVEPVLPNQILLGFDLFSLDAREGVPYRQMLESFQPLVTNRISPAQDLPPELFVEGSYHPDEYYVMLFHPGIPLSNQPEESTTQTPSVAALVISVNAIIGSSLASFEAEDLSVYLFGHYTSRRKPPRFLGHGYTRKDKQDIVIPLDMDNAENEPVLENLSSQSSCSVESIPVNQRTWEVVVCHNTGYETKILFPILGSACIMLATLLLAFWVYSSQRKAATIARIKAQAESERAAIIIASANKAAQQERDLNEYLAHEIRNPLSAALAAGNFLGASVHEERPLSTIESVQSCREDVHVVQSSLKFIDELLRSMLDMHKIAKNQLFLQERPIELARDVFETVRTVVDSKHNPFEFLIDCPTDLVVVIDCLKVKQVIMNLATNSRKFVSKGYIKVGAYVEDESVFLFVEDSGPSIPPGKRDHLFTKYQPSLDSLTPQGTGIGLNLCKTLIELMGGEIYLDEDFVSSIEDCPGTRFIICLNRPPVAQDDTSNEKIEENRMLDNASPIATDDISSPEGIALPENLLVLVCDDDYIVRRMIIRSLQRIAPSWKIEQCADGETALKLAEEADRFDLIFVDQYMASNTRTMLGTETVHAMRARGVTACLCGLSANPLEEGFLAEGANSFIQKPFPCEKEALTKEVYRVLQTHSSFT